MPWQALRGRVAAGEIVVCPKGLQQCNREFELSQIQPLPNNCAKRKDKLAYRWAAAIKEKYIQQTGMPNDLGLGVIEYVGYAKSLGYGLVTSHQDALTNLNFGLVGQLSGVTIYRVPNFVDWMVAN